MRTTLFAVRCSPTPYIRPSAKPHCPENQALLTADRVRIPRSAYLIFIIGALVRIKLLALSHREVAILRLPDDALYYFTIAKQFALGHGISFDGITATNGFHPLWLFLLLPVAFLKLGPWAIINSVLTIQTLLDIVNIWMVIRLVQQQIDAVQERVRNLAVGIAVASYALNASVVIRGINGLETTLAALLLLVWLSLYCSLYRDGLSARVYSSRGSSQRRALLWFGFVSGLLFLARTDFAVIEAVSVVILALVHRRELKRIWRAVVGSIMIALAVSLPWLIWNVITFGSIVQVSANAIPFFANKKLDVLYSDGGKALYLLRESARNLLKPFFFTAFGLPLIVLILPMLRKGREQFVARLSGSGLLPPIFGALLLLLYHTIVRGFIRDWYVLQLLPMISVALGASVAYWLEGQPQYRLWSRVLIAATVLGLTALSIQEISTPRYPSQAVMLSVAESLGTVKESSTIGSFNSGYYSFFASDSVYVQDLDGVVNPTIYPYIINGNIHQYLDKQGIDYLLDYSGTIGGYRGLIDNDLTSAFRNKRMIGTQGNPDSLELLGRRKVLFR